MNLKLVLFLMVSYFSLPIFSQNQSIFATIGGANVPNAGPLQAEGRAGLLSLHYRIENDRKGFYQFSINNFWKHQDRKANNEIDEFQIGLQYAHGWRFWQLNPRTTLRGGFSGGPSYYQLESESLNGTSFPLTQRNFSLQTGGFLDLQINFWERFIFNMHFPVGVVQFGVEEFQRHDPGRPVRQQKNTGFNFDVVHAFGVHLGFGWRFWSRKKYPY